MKRLIVQYNSQRGDQDHLTIFSPFVERCITYFFDRSFCSIHNFITGLYPGKVKTNRIFNPVGFFLKP